MNDWINEIICEQKRDDAFNKFIKILEDYRNMGYTYDELEYGITCLLLELNTVTAYIFIYRLSDMLDEVYCEE